MSFYVIHEDGAALLASDRAVVKARDTGRLHDAAALLANLGTLHRTTEARCREVEQAAYEHGHRLGLEQGSAAFVAAIAEVTLQAREDRLAQEHQIAQLALAALRRMVEEIGDEAMLTGAARRAVASVLPADDIQVHVAPGLAEAVAAALAGDERMQGVTVRPDAELAPHQCRVVTGAGRVIADLDRQIEAIEERWSTAHVD